MGNLRKGGDNPMPSYTTNGDWALSSEAERFLDAEEVGGSSPPAPTTEPGLSLPRRAGQEGGDSHLRGGPSCGGPLCVRLYEDADSLADLAPAWDALVREAQGTVFHTSSWVHAWWEAFGGKRRWYVWGVWSGNRLVGLAPFCLERTRLGARRLRLLGAPEADYGGVLAAPGWEGQVTRLATDALYEDRGWEVLWMPEVPADNQAAVAFADRLQRLGCWRSYRWRWSHRIPLPGSWEEYLACLSPGSRKRLLQKARQVDRVGGVLAGPAHPHDPELGMAAFIEAHRRQWSRRGSPGAFKDPRTRGFHQRLAEQLHVCGVLDLWWLLQGDSRVAAVYDFRYGSSVYSYLSALASDALRKLSPGLMLTLWRVRAAIEDGYRWYDLLRGDEPYKSTLGARPYPSVSYQLVHPKRWRGWWYLAVAPRRDRMLRREEAHARHGKPLNVSD